MERIKNFIRDDSGATAIEYGLIAALVAVVVIGTLMTLGGEVRDTFSDVSTAISTARTAGGN